MSEWKTIESAPKDGTRILVADGEDGGQSVAVWDADNAMFVVAFPFGEAAPLYRSNGEVHEAFATHWMPLPEPPQ
jgi:hypothetical protein